MNRPKRLHFWLWMLWLGVFVGLEAWAIVNPEPGDTLSESVWFLQRQWWPLTVILAVVFVFLIVHFIFDRRSRK